MWFVPGEGKSGRRAGRGYGKELAVRGRQIAGLGFLGFMAVN